ncbi:MAG: CinA family protein [Bacilli bacterium]
MTQLNSELTKFLTLVSKYDLTFGSVESFTGGLFASTITARAGVSKYYLGSIVSYSEIIKEKVVGVSSLTIEKYTVVSKEVAEEMAKEGARTLGVDLCVSFTGNAGPGICPGDKSVGLFYISIFYQNKIHTFEFKSNGKRNYIRKKAVNYALIKINEILS